MKAKIALLFILYTCMANAQTKDTTILSYLNNYRDSMGLNQLAFNPHYYKAAKIIAKFVHQSLYVSTLDSVKGIIDGRTAVWTVANNDSIELFYDGAPPQQEEAHIFVLYTMLIAKSKTKIISFDFDVSVYNIWLLSNDYRALFTNPNALSFSAYRLVTKAISSGMFYSIFEVTGIGYVK